MSLHPYVRDGDEHRHLVWVRGTTLGTLLVHELGSILIARLPAAIEGRPNQACSRIWADLLNLCAVTTGRNHRQERAS